MTLDPQEARYRRQEELNDRRRSATVRRGPVGLIAVCLLVSLGVGVVAALDLRRLETPRGTALAWTGALLFGDCTAYDRLTLQRPQDARARCRDLRARSDAARDRPSDVDFSVVRTAGSSERATAVLRVRRLDDAEREVELPLRRREGRWVVDAGSAVCAALPCPTG